MLALVYGLFCVVVFVGGVYVFVFYVGVVVLLFFLLGVVWQSRLAALRNCCLCHFACIMIFTVDGDCLCSMIKIMKF